MVGFFVSVSLPLMAMARSQGVKFSLSPTVVESKNSQTMSLLEGHLNTKTLAPSSSHLAIIDGSALEAEGDQNATFADAGLSGTGQISVYIVRSGDTLATVAKMFGVSKNTIIWANDIKGGTVSVGQELVILPLSGVKHTVKSGDTLKSIATKYKADINDILAYNDVSLNEKLAVGDVIIVPDGEIAPVKTTTTSGPKAYEPLLVNVNKYPTYAGYYARPINGGRESQGLHGYNGVDLAAPSGTPIYASAAGRVIISKSSGYNGGYGTYVVISHENGTQTLYAHMSKDLVSVGQAVIQGQQIGAIGMTGKTTGPHVHFEVRGAKNPF